MAAGEAALLRADLVHDEVGDSATPKRMMRRPPANAWLVTDLPTNDTSANSADSGERVTVRAEDLIVGRRLQFPLHDDKSILLLADGSEITSVFKQRLIDRGITNVQLSPEDAAGLTTPGAAAASNHAPADLFDQLTEPLDAIVDSGALFVANTGLAVSERTIQHGCKGYDPSLRAALLDEQRDDAASLDGMIQEVAAGNRCDGAGMMTMAGRYVGRFAEDADCVASIATAAGSDPALSDHCLRMSILSMAIGVEMGLDERNVRDLGLCGLVHDWGMVRVPEALRNADRVLSTVEFLQIKKHPIYSLEMLQRVSGLPSIVPLVCYQVHEQPNGGGYPRGRRGNSIHLFARILKVADVYAGMVERRPHRPPFSPYSANECLVRQAKEGNVDGRVVRALLRMTALFPISSYVTLTDGRVARVLRRNGDDYTAPIVQVVQNADGSDIVGEMIVDLVDSPLAVERALATPGTDEVLLEPNQVFVNRG